MTAALKPNGEVPSFARESMLLRAVASEPNIEVSERRSKFRGQAYSVARIQAGSLAGFGRGSSRRVALVRAAAELLERRFMVEVFRNEYSQTPTFLQTSNGFAVHFDPEIARANAKREAFERHLLQLSFFKSGWRGFELISEVTTSEYTLWYAGSQFTIAGIRAGIVIAQSPKFPGLAFGYFVDEVASFAASIRWNHAVSEAIDKIEPFLKVVDKSNDLRPIERAILEWMMTPRERPEFSRSFDLINLPMPSMSTEQFDLTTRWSLEFPLYGAFCRSDQLLPLIIPGRVRGSDVDSIKSLFERFGISGGLPQRNPIL